MKWMNEHARREDSLEYRPLRGELDALAQSQRAVNWKHFGGGTRQPDYTSADALRPSTLLHSNDATLTALEKAHTKAMEIRLGVRLYCSGTVRRGENKDALVECIMRISDQTSWADAHSMATNWENALRDAIWPVRREQGCGR